MKMGSGKGSMAAEPKLAQRGMKDRAPSSMDKSMKPSGGRVNSESTRDSTAKTPKTLGPRN